MPSRPLKAPSKEKAQVVFGATLRSFREAQALTQEALAERADLHTNYVSSVERGNRLHKWTATWGRLWNA